MTLNSQYTLRTVADDHVIIVQGKHVGATAFVLTLNETATYLWQSLQGQTFSLADVATLLETRYQVDHPTALADAQQWIDVMAQHGIINA